jgi:kumamolisin
LGRTPLRRYDLVSLLGTPHVDNLAEDLLAIQKTWIGVR